MALKSRYPRDYRGPTVLGFPLRCFSVRVMACPGEIMAYTTETTSRGLESYVSRKHAHPLHTLASVVEGLLSLVGVVIVILWLSQGSFTGAGKKLDNAQHDLTTLWSKLSGAAMNQIAPPAKPAKPTPKPASKIV